MDAQGFMADFLGFAQQGHIGVSAAIELSSAAPEIGSAVSVTCRGVVRGVLHGSDGRQWPVIDGARLRIAVQGPLTLSLCEADGRVIVQEHIEPTVQVPELLAWGVPGQTDYAGGQLALNPQMRAADSAEFFWRCAGQANWQRVEADMFVPLAAHRGRIELRALLRSRHAALSPLATVEIRTDVAIDHPKPEWSLVGNERALRFQPAELQLRVRWALSARLVAATGEAACAVQHPQWPLLSPTLHFDSAAVAEVPYEVEITALDGAVTRHSRTLSVLPRPARCNTRVGPEGSVHYSFENAQDPQLILPGDIAPIDLPAPTGVIEHGYRVPVHACIVFVDDAGASHQVPVALCLPAPEWARLPAMPALSWA